MTRADWERRIADGDLKLSDLEILIADWEEDSDKLESQRDQLMSDITHLEKDIAELEQREPEWGNCRRGCPPAYLNNNGYCSMACELGQGEKTWMQHRNLDLLQSIRS